MRPSPVRLCIAIGTCMSCTKLPNVVTRCWHPQARPPAGCDCARHSAFLCTAGWAVVPHAATAAPIPGHDEEAARRRWRHQVCAVRRTHHVPRPHFAWRNHPRRGTLLELPLLVFPSNALAIGIAGLLVHQHTPVCSHGVSPLQKGHRAG